MPTIYRLRRSTRYLAAGALLVLAAFLAWWLWLEWSRLNGFDLISIVFWGIILSVVVYRVASMWVYRFEFYTNGIRIRSISGKERQTVYYKEIRNLKQGKNPGRLLLYGVPYEPLDIPASLTSETGVAFLDEITLRIGVNRVEPNLAASLWRYKPIDYINIIVKLVPLVWLPIMALFLVVQGIIKPLIAWRSVNLGPFTKLSRFILDEAGNPWMLTQREGIYRFFHYTRSGNHPLKAPSVPIYFDIVYDGEIGLMGSQPFAYWPVHSSGVLTSYDGQFLNDEAQWEHVSISLPFKSHGAIDVIASPSKVWLLSELETGKGDELFELDFATGKTIQIPRPETAIQMNLEPSYYGMRFLSDGGLLVAMQDRLNHNVWLYLLRESRWQENGWPVQVPISLQQITDFTISPMGNIFVLGRLQSTSDASSLGEYEASSAKWRWDILDEFDKAHYPYPVMVFDIYERLWVGPMAQIRTDSSYLEDRVTVFERAPEGGWRRLIQYSSDNSNCNCGAFIPFQMGPDGRLWLSDDGLTWIDTTAKELPPHLPGWLVIVSTVDNLSGLHLGISGCTLLLLVIQTILAKRAKKEYNPPLRT